MNHDDITNEQGWSINNSQGHYFRLDNSQWTDAEAGKDYPNGVYRVTGKHSRRASDPKTTVEITHIATGKVRPLTANANLGFRWTAIEPPGNPCAECEGVAPIHDYLCKQCRG